MVTPNASDAILWAALALAYFRLMDSGFRPDNEGTVRFAYASWKSSLLKAAIVAAPLPLWMLFPELRRTPIWDAVAFIALACIAAPIAFPYMHIELERLTLSEKIAKWIISRIDIAIKKGLVLGKV